MSRPVLQCCMRLPTLTGENIKLRRFKCSDVDSIVKYANDKLVSRYLPRMPHPYDTSDALEFVNYAHRTARSDSAYHFGIEWKGDIVGSVGLKHFNLKGRNGEIGYCVARRCWRRGIASESLRLILDFVFDDLKLHRVYALVLKKNAASAHLLEKLGFTREGVLREASLLNRQWHDVFAYSLLDQEYRRS